MTAFNDAFNHFRYLPFPDRPQGEKLRNWGTDLLALDTFVAGEAMQVDAGTMAAGDVPDLEQNIAKAKSLLRDLDALTFEVGTELSLLEEFRTYAAALLRMLEEMGALAASAEPR